MKDISRQITAFILKNTVWSILKNNPEVQEEVAECLNNIRRRFKLA